MQKNRIEILELFLLANYFDSISCFFNLFMYWKYISHISAICSRLNYITLNFTTQILTQEDWNVVLYNGMASTSPWASLYFVALMTFGNYVLFNLLVAILVEGFQAEVSCYRNCFQEGQLQIRKRFRIRFPMTYKSILANQTLFWTTVVITPTNTYSFHEVELLGVEFWHIG